MRTAAAVLGSVAAHAVIGAVLVSALFAADEPGELGADDAAPATAAPAPAPIANAATEPVIDVTIIDARDLIADASDVRAPIATPVAATRARDDHTMIASSRSAHLDAEPDRGASSGAAIDTAADAGSGESSPSGSGAHGSSMMTMRAPTLGVPDDVMSRIASGGKPPPAPVVPSGKLHDTGGGAAVISDAVTTVKVSPDGTAHFDDKRDIDIHVHLPIPTISGLRDGARGVGEAIGQWYQDPYKGTRAGSAGELPKYAQSHPGECTSNDDVMCNGGVDDGAAQINGEGGGDGSRPNGTVPLIGGKLDISAYLMRKFHNGDPFEARKRKLLEDTFDERAQRGEQHEAVERSRSAELMAKNLAWMWSSTADPHERKRLLFEMWDDCTEDDAGGRARAMVIGWIGSKLPAGSASAFTAAELAAFDARRTSKQHFAPYAAAAATATTATTAAPTADNTAP